MISKNPLSYVPVRYRAWAYFLASFALLVWASLEAADGDWKKAIGLVLSSLVPAMAKTHTPKTP